MVPRHSACCFGSLKTRTQINEEAAGNNYFLISSQAALLVRSLSLKGKGNRESMPLLTSTRCFLKEYKVSKVHLALLKYKIDEWFYRGLKGLFVSCYTWFNNGPSIIFSCDGKKKRLFLFWSWIYRICTASCPHSICFNMYNGHCFVALLLLVLSLQGAAPKQV